MFNVMLARIIGKSGTLATGKLGLGIMSLMALIKLVLVVAIIIVAVKLFNKHMGSSQSALKILDERFARGEIDEEEYNKRKEFLTRKK